MPQIPPNVVTILFWILFAVEGAASIGGVVFVLGPGAKRAGPEGPVGAWIVFLPPLFLLIVLAVFLLVKVDGVRLSLVIMMAFPLLMALLGPVRTAVLNYQVDRSLRGDDSFSRGSHRDLAHAIHQQNLEDVRRLMLSDRKELSAEHNGETLLRFALVNAQRPGSPGEAVSLEIVKALLDAGADPNVPTYGSNWPLTLAILHDAEMTALLLRGGADPNKLDGASRPLWWDSLSSPLHAKCLEVLLVNGANATLRDSESGAAAYAASFKNWDAAWVLVRAGAKWEGEQRYGEPVERMLFHDLQSYRGEKKQIPESMRNLMKLSGLE